MLYYRLNNEKLILHKLPLKVIYLKFSLSKIKNQITFKMIFKFGLKLYFANFYQLFTNMFDLNPIFGVLALKWISDNLQNIVAKDATAVKCMNSYKISTLRRGHIDTKKTQLLLHNSIWLLCMGYMYTVVNRQTVFGLLHRSIVQWSYFTWLT